MARSSGRWWWCTRLSSTSVPTPSGLRGRPARRCLPFGRLALGQRGEVGAVGLGQRPAHQPDSSAARAASSSSGCTAGSIRASRRGSASAGSGTTMRYFSPPYQPVARRDLDPHADHRRRPRLHEGVHHEGDAVVFLRRRGAEEPRNAQRHLPRQPRKITSNGCGSGCCSMPGNDLPGGACSRRAAWGVGHSSSGFAVQACAKYSPSRRPPPRS